SMANNLMALAGQHPFLAASLTATTVIGGYYFIRRISVNRIIDIFRAVTGSQTGPLPITGISPIIEPVSQQLLITLPDLETVKSGFTYFLTYIILRGKFPRKYH